MALNKYSYQSDAIANLYRAALYLARGSREVGLQFLNRARERLGDRLDPKVDLIIHNKEKYLDSSSSCLYWAEKILDQYYKLKNAKPR